MIPFLPAHLDAAHVTAVVVTRGPGEYLAATLAALAAGTRAPETVVVVDTEGVEPLDLPPGVRALTAAGADSLGEATRRALAELDRPDPGEGRQWLWLLHADSAPEPGALAALLTAVEVAPSVGVAGPKQRSWTDPTRVLEAGVTTSRFGRRMSGLDGPELDQGQYDSREDVLAVGTAGALVRRDVWDELGGPDPALGVYGDGLDLSRRARLAGHRVILVPQAAVRHARLTLGVEESGEARGGWDRRRSARARRVAMLHSQLTGVPAPLVPVVAALALGSGVVRSAGRIALKEPELALGELTAPLVALGRPRAVLAARRRAAATRRLPRRALRPLQTTWRDVARLEQDRRLSAAEARRAAAAPSELERAELALIRSRRRWALAGVGVGALALTALVLGSTIVRVVTGVRLRGGGLAFGDADLGELATLVTTAWTPAGFGRAGPADALGAVLLPGTAVLGSVGAAAAALLLGSLVLAALGAWFAAGAVTRSPGARAWAALAWTAAPPLLLAVQDARLGAVVAHLALPWAALGLARALGVARIDAVVSGLVGAGADPDAAPELVVRQDRAAEPSVAAGAGGALALAVATAGAPVLLPAVLGVLVLLAVVVPRRRVLLWFPLPALALAGPTLTAAVTTLIAGDPGAAVRLLVADPGEVLAAGSGPGWLALLGWPVAPPTPEVLGDVVGLVAPIAASGVIAALALAALATGRRPAVAGWFAAAGGLAAAGVAGLVPVALTADGVVATAWSGAGVSLVLLGLGAAALAGLPAVSPRALAVLAVVAALGPLALVGGWALGLAQGHDTLAAVPVPGPAVPAAGTQMQTGPDRVRVLRLEVTGPDELRAGLLTGDGPQITAASRAAAVARVVGAGSRLGAAPAPPDAADAEFAEAVGLLGAGVGDDAAARLAALGIGAVLVPADDTVLTARLDSTAGLERMTRTEIGTIWRVAVGELGTTAAWARTVTADGVTPLAATGREVTTDVPPGAADRVVVLAERADPGWRAWLDGRPLRAVESSWRQTFELGGAAGLLEIRHETAEQGPWLAAQLTVLVITALLAVPVPRRRGGTR